MAVWSKIATFAVLLIAIGLLLMKSNELIKELTDAGCYFVRHGGRHDMWKSPITGNLFAVPRHNKEIPTGTEKTIRKASGVTR